MLRVLLLAALFCTFYSQSNANWDAYHSPAGLCLTDEDHVKISRQGRASPNADPLHKTIDAVKGRSLALMRQYQTLERFRKVLFDTVGNTSEYTAFRSIVSGTYQAQGDLWDIALSMEKITDNLESHFFSQGTTLNPRQVCQQFASSFTLSGQNEIFFARFPTSDQMFLSKDGCLSYIDEVFKTKNVIVHRKKPAEKKSLNQILSNPAVQQTSKDIYDLMKGQSSFDQLDLSAHQDLEKDLRILERAAPTSATQKDVVEKSDEAVDASAAASSPKQGYIASEEDLRLVSLAMMQVQQGGQAIHPDGVNIEALSEVVLAQMKTTNPNTHLTSDSIGSIIRKDILMLDED